MQSQERGRARHRVERDPRRSERADVFPPLPRRVQVRVHREFRLVATRDARTSSPRTGRSFVDRTQERRVSFQPILGVTGRSLLGFARELLRRGPAGFPETSLLLSLLALLRMRRPPACAARGIEGRAGQNAAERKGVKKRRAVDHARRAGLRRWATRDRRAGGRGTHLRLLPPSGGRGRLIHAGGRGDRSAVPCARGEVVRRALARAPSPFDHRLFTILVSQNSSGEIGATSLSSSGGGASAATFAAPPRSHRTHVLLRVRDNGHHRARPRPRPPRRPVQAAGRRRAVQGSRADGVLLFRSSTCPATSSSARRLRRTPRGSWTSRCWRRSRACARSSRRSAARITTRPSPRWWTCFEPPPRAP